MKYQPKLSNEIGMQIGLWIGYFIFEIFAYVNYEYTFQELTFLFFCALPAKLLFIYSMIFWTIPKFFFEKKYIAFALITLSILLISTFMHRYMVHFYFFKHFRPEVFKSAPLTNFKPFIRIFEHVATIGSVFISFSMVRFSYEQQRVNNQLMTANVTAELKNLKDQIKPHFLFNTLNNLYGLTEKNPAKAAEVVMRLSHLMSYMLYSSNAQKVSIGKEVDYLQDYLELEKLRYREDLQVSFQRRIENEGFQIPPLLLQPFIENAFKHGLSKQLKDAWLQIDLVVDSNEMNFKVVNSKPEQSVNGVTSGIGIENVRKRLDLLYKENYRLKIMDEGQTFLVNLSISNDAAVKVRSNSTYENSVSAY